MCEMCGYRVEFARFWLTWLSAFAEGGVLCKPRRWPQRRRMGMECPECGWLVIVAQEVSGRGTTVTEFV